LLANLDTSHTFVVTVYRMLCNNSDYMYRHARTIINKNGEGVMLRKPGSVYENGRSHNIFKYKLVRDSEAVIVKRKNYTDYICKTYVLLMVQQVRVTSYFMTFNDKNINCICNYNLHCFCLIPSTSIHLIFILLLYNNSGCSYSLIHNDNLSSVPL